ncbi:MAG: hypothetical protein HYW86_01080 [Candidatus Roizmanbacteria bacterium]|nr:MAG: hypothetical protein HYW86_01080 [Candidatus Roizmanbacteria bacterium]
MKNDSFDDLMLFISRIILIIPLVVIFIGSIIFARNKIDVLRTFSVKQKEIITPSILPSPKPTQNLSTKSETSEVKIDLKGPFVCNYSSKESTLSAQIKDKNIWLERKESNNTSYYLLKGDCLYMWENGNSGTKMCSLSQYISMFETFSSLGIMNISSMLEAFSKSGISNKNLPQEAVVNDILKTCKKESVDQNKFNIPNKVNFKSKP